MRFDPEMLRLAQEARGHAYAPYSGFPVGACIRSAEGRYYAGCNVENASYPEGSCAETGALAQMIAAGDRTIAAVLILAESEEPCTPCGGCRQRIAEFAKPDVPLFLCNLQGLRATSSLGDLLPKAFANKKIL